jgi:DNA-binding GntR family transcriptional regulator
MRTKQPVCLATRSSARWKTTSWMATIQPGERVDEQVLAERFRVSRAPVRDAIGRLATLGLIDVKPRSGSYVTRLDVAELFQLFEVMA